MKNTTRNPVKWSVRRWFNLPMATITTSVATVCTTPSRPLRADRSGQRLLPPRLHRARVCTRSNFSSVSPRPDQAGSGSRSRRQRNSYDNGSGTARARLELARSLPSCAGAWRPTRPCGPVCRREERVVADLLMGTAVRSWTMEQNDGVLLARRVGTRPRGCPGCHDLVHARASSGPRTPRPKTTTCEHSRWTFQVTLANVSDTVKRR